MVTLQSSEASVRDNEASVQLMQGLLLFHISGNVSLSSMELNSGSYVKSTNRLSSLNLNW